LAGQAEIASRNVLSKLTTIFSPGKSRYVSVIRDRQAAKSRAQWHLSRGADLA